MGLHDSLGYDTRGSLLVIKKRIFEPIFKSDAGGYLRGAKKVEK